jgi:hypothetical protein
MTSNLQADKNTAKAKPSEQEEPCKIVVKNAARPLADTSAGFCNDLASTFQPCRKASLILYLIGCFVGGGEIAKNNLW